MGVCDTREPYDSAEVIIDCPIQVIYQEVGSPGVEVDVEDLEELEEGDEIGEMVELP